jgi:hypothetical protein
MLLNISVFLWFGAVCPWATFRDNDVIPLWRLVLLGILILLFRRIPVVFAMHKFIREIEHFQQAAFVGFFGPIGVSAIFYLYISLDFLRQITVDGDVREDAQHLSDIMRVVIWFLAVCSIVVHGLTVPLGKVGYHLPRTMSQALSSEREDDQPHVNLRRPPERAAHHVRRRNIQKSKEDRQPIPTTFRIGIGHRGSSSRSTTAVDQQHDGDGHDNHAEPNRPIRFLDTPPPEPQTPVRVGSPPPSREGGRRGPRDEDIEMAKNT